MWNEYSSPYGNEYSSSSPWNEYSLSNEVPVLIDKQGNFYGYFTTNDTRHDAVNFSSYFSKLFKHYKGNLEMVRKDLCKSLN